MAVGPTIKAVHELANTIKLGELERLRGRLDKHGVSKEVEAEIEATMERLVNKVLHAPLQSLRQETEAGNGSELLIAFRKLFQIEQQ